MNKRYIAFLIAITFCTPALGWWDFGHKTTATIAWEHVKPQTRAAIIELLRHERAVETPTCPLKSLEDASYWPDCIKGLGARFDYAFSWHYQNVDVCKPFDLKAACKDGHCVSRQIDRNVKLLGDKDVPARERLVALAFLSHFVGDLHMPLHAGDRTDRGGNDVKAAYGMVEGRINLHLLWDGYLAERAITSPPSGPQGIAEGLTEQKRDQLSAGTTEDWSRESWALAKDVAYATALDGDPCGIVPARAQIDNEKIERLVPEVRGQMLKGGLRLARLLDAALL
ncbi:MAG: S1/P1 nuclease [Chakrabartia sp.]